MTNWFSSTRSWLNGFEGPVAGAVQDVLYGVQRTLFSPAPTVKPVQFSTWTAGEPILGAVRYVQPGGAAVGMELTQAPTLGTVQLLSSGAYTYTPGPDFAGVDSFTAEVTAGGVNLLEPFTARTVSVVVNINPDPPVMSTQGYDIKNLSAKGVYLAAISPSPGYEGSVVSRPVGTILEPGETFHVELTKWSFYYYYTNFTFQGCRDISCDFGVSDQNWTVEFYKHASANIFNDDTSKCLGTGWCSDASGFDINTGSTRAAIVGYSDYFINLLDTRAPIFQG